MNRKPVWACSCGSSYQTEGELNNHRQLYGCGKPQSVAAALVNLPPAPVTCHKCGKLFTGDPNAHTRECAARDLCAFIHLLESAVCVGNADHAGPHTYISVLRYEVFINLRALGDLSGARMVMEEAIEKYKKEHTARYTGTIQTVPAYQSYASDILKDMEKASRLLREKMMLPMTTVPTLRRAEEMVKFESKLQEALIAAMHHGSCKDCLVHGVGFCPSLQKAEKLQKELGKMFEALLEQSSRR